MHAVVGGGDLVGGRHQCLAERVARAPAADAGGAVARQDGRAVVEAEPVAEREGPSAGRRSRGPAASSICGCGRVSGVQAEQRVVDEEGVVAGLLCGGPPGRGRRGRPPARSGAAGPRRPGRCAGRTGPRVRLRRTGVFASLSPAWLGVGLGRSERGTCGGKRHLVAGGSVWTAVVPAWRGGGTGGAGWHPLKGWDTPRPGRPGEAGRAWQGPAGLAVLYTQAWRGPGVTRARLGAGWGRGGQFRHPVPIRRGRG